MASPRPSPHPALPAQRISRINEADPLTNPTENGPADVLYAESATLYRVYIERLVQRWPLPRVVAAGGQELMNLERYCHGSGDTMIQGIAPALNGFFNCISAESPGIWNRFTCADAAAVIRDVLGQRDVLDREGISESELCG